MLKWCICGHTNNAHKRKKINGKYIRKCQVMICAECPNGFSEGPVNESGKRNLPNPKSNALAR